MEDNRFADITLSEKLQQEASTRTTAYDVGEFYLDVRVLGNDHNVTLYDRNFLEIAKETHTDPSMTTTQAINNFCEKYEFEGAENLKTRSVTMLDPQVFHQNLFEMQAQAKASQELESGFQNSDTPQFAIYRMNGTEKHENIETEDYLAFQSLGGEVDKKDYLCIAEGNLEDLIPDYQERLNENPFELAEDVQATITDFAQLGEAFEEKYGIPNSGDVFVFQHQGKEEAFFMDFTDQHKIDFQEQAPKVKEKAVEQEQTTPEQAVVQEEKDDMKLDIYQKSDKLSIESGAGVVAYQVGDFFVTATDDGLGIDVNLYDSNLERVAHTSYEDMQDFTQALNQFSDDFQFDGIETLRNRSADMLNFDVFNKNYDKAYEIRDESMDLEHEWYNNPKDSFAIHSLNPTEHNEQLEGRNMAFLENVGEDLDKRNFHCIFTDDLASLKENDPMFYGNTDMEQHFNDALEELQNGDGEKLLTMLQVKSPKMEGLENEMQTGCILSLKIDGEVINYFMEDYGLEKVEFMELPPKFKEMAVEEQKKHFFDDIFAQMEENTPTTVNLDTVTITELQNILEQNNEVATKVADTISLFEMNNLLDKKLPFEELHYLNQVAEVFQSEENVDKNTIFGFLADTLNDTDLRVEDLQILSYQDLGICFDHKDVTMVVNYVEVAYAQQEVEKRNTAEAFAELQEYFEDTIPESDLQLLNELANKTAIYSEELRPELIKEYLIDEIHEGKISFNDLNFLTSYDVEKAINSHEGILLNKEVQLEKVVARQQERLENNLENKSLVDPETKPELPKESDLSTLTTKKLLEEMQQNHDLSNTVKEARDISIIVSTLGEPLPFEDMKKINDFATDIWLKYEETTKEEITDFIGTAINLEELTVSDLDNISQSDFFDCLCDKDSGKLGEIVAEKQEEQTIPQEKVEENTLESNLTLENRNLSAQEKLQQEDVLSEVAYQVGENSLYFKVDEQEVTYAIFDKNLDDVEIGKYENMNLTEGINEFAKTHELPEIEKLAEREAPLLHVDTLVFETSQRAKEQEQTQVPPDLVPVEGEENLFHFSLTNQERVVIHAATDHQYDYNSDIEQEQREVLRDIIDELDPKGDLWKQYPDNYTFDPSDSIEEKVTLNFTGEQLEAIAESCHEASVSWENIPESYRDILDSIEEKVENKGIGIAEMTMENPESTTIPENEPRIAAHSYEIIDSVVMGGEEIAVGESPSGMAGTWERNIVADEEKGLIDNWYSGHYFGTTEEAMEDFQQRIEDKLEEREAIYGEQSMYSEKNPDNQEEKKPDGKEEKNKAEKNPRESVMAKLKEIKSQIAQKENKEQPTKTKPDQSI